MNREAVTATLIAHGLARPVERPNFTPLAGGVSCDVYRVDLARGPICVKQALPRLRVAGDWRVDPARAHAEALWLAEAPALDVPAPRLLLEDRATHLIAMEYLPPATHPVWKDRLMVGVSDTDFAREVGAVLARMHAASRDDARLAACFANGALFDALRVDPFLREIVRIHPDLKDAVALLIAQATAPVALVHGDFSPKNILYGPDGPVILDAECAVFAAPAFDIAFCLTHLLLKTLHVGPAIAADARAFVAGYGDVEEAAPLVAALLLARVDGKSPAGYLTAAARERVRATARGWLLAGPPAVGTMIEQWVAL